MINPTSNLRYTFACAPFPPQAGHQQQRLSDDGEEDFIDEEVEGHYGDNDEAPPW